MSSGLVKFKERRDQNFVFGQQCLNKAPNWKFLLVWRVSVCSFTWEKISNEREQVLLWQFWVRPATTPLSYYWCLPTTVASLLLLADTKQAPAPVCALAAPRPEHSHHGVCTAGSLASFRLLPGRKTSLTTSEQHPPPAFLIPLLCLLILPHFSPYYLSLFAHLLSVSHIKL